MCVLMRNNNPAWIINRNHIPKSNPLCVSSTNGITLLIYERPLILIKPFIFPRRYPYQMPHCIVELSISNPHSGTFAVAAYNPSANAITNDSYRDICSRILLVCINS